MSGIHRRATGGLALLGLALAAASASGQAAAAVALPRALEGGWSLAEGPRRYRGNGLFDYMDGAAEVHRMYGFRSLVVWRYARAKAALKVELFDMGSPAGAFGDFTHARDLEGQPVDLGQDGHYQSGVLWFWKGRHLVCVSSRSEGVDRATLVRAGRVVEGKLRAGKRPALASRLPRAGLRGPTVRYFRVAAALSYHYGDYPHASRLGLDGRRAEAVLADYKTAAGASVLLLVRYRSSQLAARVERRLAGATGRDRSAVRLGRRTDGRWTGLWRRGRQIWVVLEAPTSAEARRLGPPVAAGKDR